MEGGELLGGGWADGGTNWRETSERKARLPQRQPRQPRRARLPQARPRAAPAAQAGQTGRNARARAAVHRRRRCRNRRRTWRRQTRRRQTTGPAPGPRVGAVTLCAARARRARSGRGRCRRRVCLHLPSRACPPYLLHTTTFSPRRLSRCRITRASSAAHPVSSPARACAWQAIEGGTRGAAGTLSTSLRVVHAHTLVRPQVAPLSLLHTCPPA